MHLKQIGALASCLALLGSLLIVPASAASVESGVYTASMVTSYYNPDTGNVDDGGTANAALGEGMCRSATDRTCLVEVDGDDIWITVRLLLQSNCSDVALYTRDSYDSYSQVSYDIMSEDAGNDSIDYRIKVSEVGQKLKCTMYVSPMGRDVLWYLYVDTSTLTEGSGDFVVSIDPSTEASVATEQPVVSPTPTPAPTTSANTSSPAPSASPSEAPDPSPAGTEVPEDTQTPDESDAPSESDTPEDTSEPSEAPEEVEDSEDDPKLEASPDESAEPGIGNGGEESSAGSGIQIGIGVVSVAVIGVVIYAVKKRKK